MDKSRILILKSDKDDFEKYFIDLFLKEGFDCRPIYKRAKSIGYVFRVVLNQYTNLPFKQITYGKWKDELGNYDTVIIFDRVLSWDILRYIRKKNENIRIIVWYWNPVKQSIELPKNIGITDVEIWSFDPEDCRKYSLRYNTQFYSCNMETHPKKYKANRPKIMFVGLDKGRYPEIKRLGQKFEDLGMDVDFSVIPDKTTKNPNDIYYLKKPMSYKQVIKKINESTMLLDLAQKHQVGLTLRALESQFFSKKLLTTNKNIVNERFYDSKNIHVIGLGSWTKSFITEPLNYISCEKAGYYSIDNWIGRFYINE